MEELSIEEKAKAYDEALERARIWKDKSGMPADKQGILDDIFPELAGSEDERIRKEIIEYIKTGTYHKDWLAWLEKQGKKSQRMISAEAKEAMYDKPADTVEPKCEESKTKVFDAPTPFEDKLYAFVLACEILVDPSKREFILEHSQEILDAAKEQIGKEQSSTWSKEDEAVWAEISDLLWEGYKQSGSKFSWDDIRNWVNPKLKSLKTRYTWKPSDEQIELLKDASARYEGLQSLYNDLNKLKGE